MQGKFQCIAFQSVLTVAAISSVAECAPLPESDATLVSTDARAGMCAAVTWVAAHPLFDGCQTQVYCKWKTARDDAQSKIPA